ncbi:ATP synthase subunit I [Amphibacillus sediminis]|uniref:ATP synthase subunit I n=1 Tax=Amphibacillus sediminis TaxID=360185 RepID=UPI000836A797|nr:ATP synthase subunit I [Amphibacillus sediminis]
MGRYQEAISRQRRWLIYVIMIVTIGTIASLANRSWLGLWLGSITSYFNLWLLQRNVNRIAEVALGNRKHASAGTISRIGSALLVVVFSLHYNAYISFFAVVIGLMLNYLIILLEALFRFQTEKTKMRRGG